MSIFFRILTLSSFLLVAAGGFSSAHAAVLVSEDHFINSPTDQNAFICLQAEDSSNSSVVFAGPCANTFNQVWNWEGSEIQGLGTSVGIGGVHETCLDVRGGGTADGTLVQIFECNGTGAQEWIYTGTGTIFNPQSGKCLDLKTVNLLGISPPGERVVNGYQAVIQTCNNSQNWAVQ